MKVEIREHDGKEYVFVDNNPHYTLAGYIESRRGKVRHLNILGEFRYALFDLILHLVDWKTGWLEIETEVLSRLFPGNDYKTVKTNNQRIRRALNNLDEMNYISYLPAANQHTKCKIFVPKFRLDQVGKSEQATHLDSGKNEQATGDTGLKVGKLEQAIGKLEQANSGKPRQLSLLTSVIIIKKDIKRLKDRKKCVPPGKVGKSEQATSAGYTAEFEQFWSHYPRKDEKKGAFKRWNTLLKAGVKADDLILAAMNYARARNGEDKKFTKMGKTFLGPDKPYEDYIKKNDNPMSADQPKSKYSDCYS